MIKNIYIEIYINYSKKIKKQKEKAKMCDLKNSKKSLP